MTRRISVFVEGDADLRIGFRHLFKEAHDAAAAKGIALQFVAAGTGAKTSNRFIEASAERTGEVIGLLVDAEAPFSPPTDALAAGRARVKHLKTREKERCAGLDVKRHAGQVHLMVQCLEAWLVADPGNLVAYYKKDFLEGRLPKTTSPEDLSPAELANALKAASLPTSKGPYHKTRHVPDLVAGLRPEAVRRACPSFAAFESWLHAAVQEAQA